MSIESYIFRGVYLLGAVGLLLLVIGGVIVFRKAKTSERRKAGILLAVAGVLQLPFMILWAFGLAGGMPYRIAFGLLVVASIISLRRFK